MFLSSHKKITLLFRYRFYFLSTKTQKYSQKHYLSLFTTSILPTIYHFLTFQLHILKNCNNNDSITTPFHFPIFDFLISKKHFKTNKNKYLFNQAQNQQRLYKAKLQVQKADEVRDKNKADYKILQERSAIAKTKIYTRTSQKSPGGSHIDNPRITYLRPFDLELPTFNLLFSSAISSKYSNSLDTNCL